MTPPTPSLLARLSRAGLPLWITLHPVENSPTLFRSPTVPPGKRWLPVKWSVSADWIGVGKECGLVRMEWVDARGGVVEIVGYTSGTVRTFSMNRWLIPAAASAFSDVVQVESGGYLQATVCGVGEGVNVAVNYFEENQ